MIKSVLMTLFIFLIIPPVYAQQIKIKATPKFDVAKNTVVKLDEKAMARHNVFAIPRGRRINVRLNDDIKKTSFVLNGWTKENDIVTAQLMKDWYYNNKMVAPEGSIVKGIVTNAKIVNSTTIKFDTIIRPDNVEIKFTAKPVIFTSEKYTIREASIPFGTEFTIQVLNDIIVKEYK